MCVCVAVRFSRELPLTSLIVTILERLNRSKRVNSRKRLPLICKSEKGGSKKELVNV